MEWKFPEKFLFGAALSDYQHFGNSECDLPKLRTADHFSLYLYDIELIHELNYSALRTSVEWARIETKENEINQSMLNWYEKYFETLKNYKIKTLATLHHFTNPNWYTTGGGWISEKNIKKFLKYVDIVSEKLAGYIDYYIIINEPLAYASMAFLNKVLPPYTIDPIKFRKCYKNLAKAIKQSYEIIKQNDKSVKVGFAHAISPLVPKNRKNPLEIIFCKYSNNIILNFLESLMNNIDFIGINYYSEFVFDIWKRRILKAVVNPEYLSKFCIELYKKYRKPLLITENGFSSRNQFYKTNYLVRHLEKISETIERGVEIEGYIWWSFLHGYEWNSQNNPSMGYKPNFGLIDVDMNTLERKVTKTAKIFSVIASKRKIDIEIHEKYGSIINYEFEDWPLS